MLNSRRRYVASYLLCFLLPFCILGAVAFSSILSSVRESELRRYAQLADKAAGTLSADITNMKSTFAVLQGDADARPADGGSHEWRRKIRARLSLYVKQCPLMDSLAVSYDNMPGELYTDAGMMSFSTALGGAYAGLDIDGGESGLSWRTSDGGQLYCRYAMTGMTAYARADATRLKAVAQSVASGEAYSMTLRLGGVAVATATSLKYEASAEGVEYVRELGGGFALTARVLADSVVADAVLAVMRAYALCMLCFLALGCGAAAWIGDRSFGLAEALRALLKRRDDEYEYLSNRMAREADIARSGALSELLRGGARDEPLSELFGSDGYFIAVCDPSELAPGLEQIAAASADVEDAPMFAEAEAKAVVFEQVDGKLTLIVNALPERLTSDFCARTLNAFSMALTAHIGRALAIGACAPKCGSAEVRRGYVEACAALAGLATRPARGLDAPLYYSMERRALLEQYIRSTDAEGFEETARAALAEQEAACVYESVFAALLVELASEYRIGSLKGELYALFGAASSEAFADAFCALGARLIEAIANENEICDAELAARIKAYIAENVASPTFGRAAAASCVDMSDKRFNRFFKATFGATFGDYVIDYRIGKAKELLSNTDMSVREIMTAVGYNDLSNFTRTFRLIVGAPPGKYRAEHAVNGRLRR